MVGDDDNVETLSDDEVEESFSDVDYDEHIDVFNGPILNTEYSPHLKADVRIANKELRRFEDTHGIPAVELGESVEGPDYCSITIHIDCSKVPERLRELWELDVSYISFFLDKIERSRFRDVSEIPHVAVAKAGEKPSRFIVGEQLFNLTRSHLEDTFRVGVDLQDPDIFGSFFRGLHNVITERLAKLTDFCIICNKALLLGGILPSVCDRDLCTYQYHDLGLYDGFAIPRVSPDILDLLLIMFFAASESGRFAHVMAPKPYILDKDSLIREMFERENKHGVGPYSRRCRVNVTGKPLQSRDDAKMLAHMASSMPCPREILNTKSYYAFRDEFSGMAKIVEWLVITNRAYLQRVPEKLLVGFAPTKDQYIFVADSPAKQHRFEALKEANGGRTKFLFHGSPLENWHSIIRNGLKIFSNTNMQLNGAAYGSGIYLAQDQDFSFSYSMRYGSTHYDGGTSRGVGCKKACCQDKPEMNPKTCSIVSLVEVIDDVNLVRVRDGNIFVVKNEEYCSVRMLFVYSLNTRILPKTVVDKKGEEQIGRVMDLFKNAALEEKVAHVLVAEMARPPLGIPFALAVPQCDQQAAPPTSNALPKSDSDEVLELRRRVANQEKLISHLRGRVREYQEEVSFVIDRATSATRILDECNKYKGAYANLLKTMNLLYERTICLEERQECLACRDKRVFGSPMKRVQFDDPLVHIYDSSSLFEQEKAGKVPVKGGVVVPSIKGCVVPSSPASSPLSPFFPFTQTAVSSLVSSLSITTIALTLGAIWWRQHR